MSAELGIMCFNTQSIRAVFFEHKKLRSASGRSHLGMNFRLNIFLLKNNIYNRQCFDNTAAMYKSRLSLMQAFLQRMSMSHSFTNSRIFSSKTLNAKSNNG